MHEIWQELLPFYAAGQLGPQENALFEAHLALCAECQRELKDWRLFSEAVQAEARERVTGDLPPLSRAIFDVPQDAAEPATPLSAPRVYAHQTHSLNGAEPQPARYGVEAFSNTDDEDAPGYAPPLAVQSSAVLKRATGTYRKAGRWNTAFSLLAAALALVLFGSFALLLNTPIQQTGSGFAGVDDGTSETFLASTPTAPAFASPARTRRPDSIPLLQLTPVIVSGMEDVDPLASVTPSQIEPIISFPARVLANTRLPQSDVSQRLAWSPDGERLALAGTRGVWLYEAETLTGLATLLADSQDSVISVAFSPDGGTLASINWAKTIRLWDVQNIQERLVLNNTPLWDGLQFSPDGRWLLSGTVDGTVTIIDAETGDIVNRINVGAGGYTAVISPDGRTLAVGNYRNDNSIWLYDVATGTPKLQLFGHTSEVRRLAFSADGLTLASGDLTGGVRLWDLTLGIEKNVMQQSGVVLGIAIDPYGSLVAATMKLSDNLHGVWLWNVRDNAQWAVMVNDTALSGPVFSPAGDLLAISSGDGRVWILDITHAQRGLLPIRD